uniref:Uncharacterized protein n=1 Tax=Plectus sambesii TaxID=2011161 RepID=A0A914X9L5_9BILA
MENSLGLPSQYRHYIFKKGSPWLPLFNNASIGQQAFAINAWEKYFGSTASARDPNEIELRCPKDPPQVRALTMETLTGLFCLLIGGSIVASASFTIEYVGCLRKTIGLKLFGPVKEMRKLARAVTREKKKLLQMKDKDRFDLYRRESYYFSGF